MIFDTVSTTTVMKTAKNEYNRVVKILEPLVTPKRVPIFINTNEKTTPVNMFGFHSISC